MSEFKPVKLVTPDGREHVAGSAQEVNDLVYGRGYTVRNNKADQTPPKDEVK